MILEKRILIAAAAVGLMSFALVFVPWQVVLPVSALAYLAYKLRYYRTRIGAYEPDPDAVTDPGQWLPHAVLGTVALFALTRLVVFRLFDVVWATSTLEIPVLVLRDIPVLVGQLIPLGVAWGAVAGPLVVLSFAAAQFRQRLLPGVDSREAAVRASLWETLVRVPVYVLWVGLVTVEPILRLWAPVPRVLGSSVGFPVSLDGGFAPLLGDVFPVIVAVGHAAPLVVIAAYYGIHATKYPDWTVPEVVGYRGLYPPSRAPTVGNIVVPVVAYLAYAAPVVVYSPGIGQAVPILLLPLAVATLAGADVQGWTTRLARSTLRRVPGVAGDAVVVGLVLGGYTLAAVATLGLSGGLALGDALTAVLVFPVVAIPASYGANRASGYWKTRTIADFVDRIGADPEALDEAEMDQLLAYVHDRDDDLRADAISALATAVGVSAYRRTDAVDVFVSALDTSDRSRDHAGPGRGRLAAADIPSVVEPLLERAGSPADRFARPALRGVATVLRDDPGLGIRERLTDLEVLRQIDGHLESPDPETRALAAEAFARVVVAGYRADAGTTLPLARFGPLPIERIEAAVEADSTDHPLDDAAVECFSTLWYRRDGLEAVLDDADVQRLLVDLVDWAPRAGDVARARAAFALTSGPAVVEAAGLDRVLSRLESDSPVVRFMGAHVVRSSIEQHVNRVDPDRLARLLDDPDPAARWAGAATVRAYVATARDVPREFVASLVDHLADVDPRTSGTAEAAVLRTLADVDPGNLPDHARVARVAATHLRRGGRPVAAPASGLLETLLAVDAAVRHEDGVVPAIEAGLTHDSEAVRGACVRAAASVVAAAPADGRPFVRGLVRNLGATAPVDAVAVSALARVIEEFPAYGTEVLSELEAGLVNQTKIEEQHAGAMVVGLTVAEVTASVAATVTEHGVRGGEGLIEPLVDLARVAEGSTREAIFGALANLSAEYPDAARKAVPVTTTALDEGSVWVRRDAGRVLANVAEAHPGEVRQVLDNLLVAVDDSDPQTRATALHVLNVVAASTSDALADDIRRIVGRLDDDSSVVRERAARVMLTVAEEQPDLVDPAAEASDRLRRIQRDPAVDIDAERLQAAATAIQTGRPADETTDVADDDTEIWTPESPDEVGSSGDTRVFDPATGGEDLLPEGTCSTCGADLGDADVPDTCPECGADLG